MAKWSFSVGTFTPSVIADTTAFTTGIAMVLQGGSATQQLTVSEILQTGLAASSSINNMTFARDSTVGVTAAALASPNTAGPMNPNSAAITGPPISAINFTGTEPQRSSVTTLARLPLGFNSFGGVIRWVAYPGEEWIIYGASASGGESSLSCPVAGAGPESGIIIYEPT